METMALWRALFFWCYLMAIDNRFIGSGHRMHHCKTLASSIKACREVENSPKEKKKKDV